ncbi:hypothetical protein C0J52_15089, partial [Blattella germanica]
KIVAVPFDYLIIANECVRCFFLLVLHVSSNLSKRVEAFSNKIRVNTWHVSSTFSLFLQVRAVTGRFQEVRMSTLEKNVRCKAAKQVLPGLNRQEKKLGNIRVSEFVCLLVRVLPGVDLGVSSEEVVTKEVQIRLHNILSKRALLHSSETWTLRAKDRKRLETTQMRFLRSVEGGSSGLWCPHPGLIGALSSDPMSEPKTQAALHSFRFRGRPAEPNSFRFFL